MKKQITTLLAEISEETRVLSFHKHDHPKLLQIVAMGDEAVPILRDHLRDYLKDRSENGESLEWAPWYAILALGMITKANPVKEEYAGRLLEIINAWLQWKPEDENQKGALTYWPVKEDDPVDIVFDAIKDDLTGRSGIGNSWEACAESYDGFEPEVKDTIRKALIEAGLIQPLSA